MVLKIERQGVVTEYGPGVCAGAGYATEPAWV